MPPPEHKVSCGCVIAAARFMVTVRVQTWVQALAQFPHAEKGVTSRWMASERRPLAWQSPVQRLDLQVPSRRPVARLVARL